MAAHVDPLVVGRVIGDVVDLFVPSVAISVRFGTKDLTNGCEIRPSVAAVPPAVHIAGRANDLFTLVRTTSSQQLSPLACRPLWLLRESIVLFDTDMLIYISLCLLLIR
jgi:hypothetical protein